MVSNSCKRARDLVAIHLVLPGCSLWLMDKLDLAQRLARKVHTSRAQAADDVDMLVYRILKDLKRTHRRSAVREEQTSTAPAAPAREKE